MMPSITIRRLQAPDLSTGALECLSQLHPDIPPWERATEIHRERIRMKVETYVAVDDSSDPRIVGTATIIVEHKFLHGGSVVCHIEDVAVHPAHQSQGIGGLLIGRLCNRAKELGAYKAILNCKPELSPWYERLGFHPGHHQMRMDISE